MRSILTVLLVAASMTVAACGGGKGGGNTNAPPPPMEVTDQSVVPNPPDAVFPIGDIDCAMTFRTATAGQLTRIEVMLSAPAMSMGTLRVDVRSQVAGGAPDLNDGNALGFVDIDVSGLPAVPTLISFDLSASNILITASQALAIVARRVAGAGDIANIHGINMNVYGNGSAWRRGGVWAQDPAVDFGFQTFVLP